MDAAKLDTTMEVDQSSSDNGDMKDGVGFEATTSKTGGAALHPTAICGNYGFCV